MATLFYFPRLARLGSHEQYFFRVILLIGWVKFLRPVLLILIGGVLAIPMSLGISLLVYSIGEWIMHIFFPMGFMW